MARARVSEAELERLKREVSVERLAEARGVKLRRKGKDLHGLCPFHEDREPSLVITPSKNLWHCLGACRTGGGPIDWVMRAEAVSFRHAVELLRRDLPSLAAAAVEPMAPPPKRSWKRKLEPIAEPEEPDAVVMDRVAGFYNAALKESPEALGYLKQRGLVHSELVDHFRLGYADRSLAYRVPQRRWKAGGALREQLARLGILRSESGHEHLRGSLVLPLLDRDGHVVQMYGRKVRRDLRPGTPLHLYLPGPHRGLLNREAFGTRELILCESVIDALTFWCAGLRNVTCAYGVNGFTEEHRKELRQSKT